MGASENGGNPKSSISIGISIINYPFWGTPIFGNTHIWWSCLPLKPTIRSMCYRPSHSCNFGTGHLIGYSNTYLGGVCGEFPVPQSWNQGSFGILQYIIYSWYYIYADIYQEGSSKRCVDMLTFWCHLKFKGPIPGYIWRGMCKMSFGNNAVRMLFQPWHISWIRCCCVSQILNDWYTRVFVPSSLQFLHGVLSWEELEQLNRWKHVNSHRVVSIWFTRILMYW